MLITPELDACRPDPTHPRHVLPDDLRERLLAGVPPAEVLWETWRRCLGGHLYQALRAHDLSPTEALARRREEGVLDLALQLTLEGLLKLADSVRRHGLRQPIDVYDLGNGRYRITEGERRWWARVMLRNVLLRAEASTILARLHPLPDDEPAALARRQAENAQRADLSPIARARALKQVLRTVTARWVSGTPEEISGAGGSRNPVGRPRHFKGATVHELHELTSQELQWITGKSISGRTVRNYLALLSLPPRAVALAEAANLSERALRPVVSLGDPEMQVTLVRALASGEMTPAQVAGEAKRLKAQKETAAIGFGASGTVAAFQNGLRFAARGDLPDPVHLGEQVARLPRRERDEVLDLAHRYVSFLQALLTAGEGLLAPDDAVVPELKVGQSGIV